MLTPSQSDGPCSFPGHSRVCMLVWFSATKPSCPCFLSALKLRTAPLPWYPDHGTCFSSVLVSLLLLALADHGPPHSPSLAQNHSSLETWREAQTVSPSFKGNFVVLMKIFMVSCHTPFSKEMAGASRVLLPGSQINQ